VTHGEVVGSAPCDSCIDIPLSVDTDVPALGKPSSSGTSPQPSEVAGLQPFLPLPALERCLREPQGDSPADGILAQLRTVVLRL